MVVTLGAIFTATAMPGTLAQQAGNLPPGFIERVDGSRNPERIPDALVYNNVSRSLVDSGPGSCTPQGGVADRTAPAFSNRAPCSVVPGVDPMLAEQLGMEYQAFVEERSAALREAMCESPIHTRLRNTSVAILAAWLDAWENEDEAVRVDFFESRGEALLGAEQFDRLLDWADTNVRPGITWIVIDTRARFEGTGVTPERMLDLSCSFSTQAAAPPR